MTDTAVIGGSGFSSLEGLEVERREAIATPYGAPSALLVFGRLGRLAVAFLPRHGDEHDIAPHRVNYRANLWALRESGVKRVFALAAVGGIAADLSPGGIVIPDQLIDYTWGRSHTFSDGRGAASAHIDFTQPYHKEARAALIAAAKRGGVEVTAGSVYAVTQGPRLETAAEIDRLERDGADLVGMTGMPEAALARELGLEYASLAMVVNPAAGRGVGVDKESMSKHLRSAGQKALAILNNL